MADWAGIYQLRDGQFQDKERLKKMADAFADWGRDFHLMSGRLGLIKRGKTGFDLTSDGLEVVKGASPPANENLDLEYCARLQWKEGQYLLLREDSVGSHPIYYLRQEDRLLFSTDIKSLLLLPDIKIKPNFKAINESLTLGGTVGSSTLFAGIYRVGASNSVKVEDGRIDKRKYWTPSPAGRTVTPKQLMELISRQVTTCAAGEDEITVPLSGGIDSSLLVDILSRETDVSVKTINLSFKEVDESDYASKVAQRYQTDHNQIDLDQDIDRSLTRIWNVPNDLPYFHLHLLASKLSPIEENSGRIFQGEGPDELLKTSRQIIWANKLDQFRLPRQIFADNYVNNLPLNWKKLLEFLTARGEAEKLATLFTWLSRAERKNVYLGKLLDHINHFGNVKRLLEGLDQLNLSNKRSYLLLNSFLSNHLLEANTLLISSKGCQAVYPYLSPSLISQSFEIGSQSKQDKLILKKACLGRLPDEIIKREKTGFGHYMRALLQENRDVVENYLHRLATRDCFSETGVKKLIKRRKNSEVFFRRDKWSYDNRALDFLFGLELWFETFIDPSTPRKLKKL